MFGKKLCLTKPTTKMCKSMKEYITIFFFIYNNFNCEVSLVFVSFLVSFLGDSLNILEVLVTSGAGGTLKLTYSYRYKYNVKDENGSLGLCFNGGS